MPTSLTRRAWPVLAAAAVLLVASCVLLGPRQSASPSGLPSATASPVATLPPGETAPPNGQATATPPTTTDTAPPTAPGATEAPTEPAEHPNWPAGALEAAAAENHVGETGTVCGKVVASNWLFSEPGHPTWLNINKAYPNLRFNVVIWGEQRRAWPLSGKPDVVYLDRVICVSGVISSYKTWTQIQDVEMSNIQVIE